MRVEQNQRVEALSSFALDRAFVSGRLVRIQVLLDRIPFPTSKLHGSEYLFAAIILPPQELRGSPLLLARAPLANKTHILRPRRWLHAEQREHRPKPYSS